MVQLHQQRIEERIKAAGGRERYEELMREKRLRQEMLVSQSGDRSKKREGGEGLLEMHGVLAGMAGIFALVSILFAMNFSPYIDRRCQGKTGKHPSKINFFHVKIVSVGHL